MLDSGISIIWIIVLYIVIIIPFGFIIFKHHSKKNSPLLVTPNYNLQRSRILYILSCLVAFFSTLLTIGFITKSNDLVNLIALIGILFAPILFFLCVIGITFVGLMGVLTGEAVFYPGITLFIPIHHKGFLGRLWGLVYFLVGLLMLLLFISFLGNVICTSQADVCKMLRLFDNLLSLY